MIWNGDYGIGSNFWKFYFIRTSFTLDELVSLVKVFKLFRMDSFGVQSVDIISSAQHLSYWQGHRVCDALFCFVALRSLKPWSFTLCSWYLLKALD